MKMDPKGQDWKPQNNQVNAIALSNLASLFCLETSPCDSLSLSIYIDIDIDIDINIYITEGSKKGFTK